MRRGRTLVVTSKRDFRCLACGLAVLPRLSCLLRGLYFLYNYMTLVTKRLCVADKGMMIVIASPAERELSRLRPFSAERSCHVEEATLHHVENDITLEARCVLETSV